MTAPTMTFSVMDSRIEVCSVRNESTVIEVGERALESLPRHLCANGGRQAMAIAVVDERAWDLHGRRLQAVLSPTGMDIHLIVVKSGESSKSISSLSRIWGELAALGARRRTTILAFGGGVVCDLAGLAAATYMRGVPYINIPTTLVAQVDAAIGGKVAVDSPDAKNALGAFYHPRAVLVWPGFLGTLPTAELAAGMAEVIKVAVLASPAAFETVEALGRVSVENVHLLRDEHLSSWIQAKLNFLAPDPYETKSLDRALNFGHEIGHAVETATGYSRFRHGEAVAIGMAVACRIAEARGILDTSIAERVVDCLRRNHLPIEVDREMQDDVWEALDAIRRVRDGSLRMVLPTGLGRHEFVSEIAYDEYRRASTTRALEVIPALEHGLSRRAL